jgi:hypothetical protein
MLIRRTVIEKIGSLDPAFFVYWEDTDFSLRARRFGYRLLHVPKATILHKVSRSSGGDESPNVYYYMWRNCYLVSKRQQSVLSHPRLLSSYVRRCFWEYCDLMRRNKREHALAVAEACWHSLIGRHGKRVGQLPSVIVTLLEMRRLAA